MNHELNSNLQLLSSSSTTNRLDNIRKNPYTDSKNLRRITKNFIFLIPVTIFFITLTLSADTIPGGNVSGTWYEANSPYYITGNITVPTDSTLSIEPGVEVIFLGAYYIRVNGSFNAIGTVNDSIYFFPEDTSSRWTGIRSGVLQLSYCDLRYAQEAIRLPSSVFISHCTMSNNAVAVSTIYRAQISNCTFRDNNGGTGGAIELGYVEEDTIEIYDCSFTNSTAVDFGGAIYIEAVESVIKISGCTFGGNTAGMGGAICAYEADRNTLEISECTFSANTTTDEYGGAIFIFNWGDNPTISISGCEFSNDSAFYFGGAIAVYGYLSDIPLEISGCTFNDNFSGGQGGAICIEETSNLNITNCTFIKNHADGIGYNFGGGAIYIDRDSINVSRCTFVNNRAYRASTISVYENNSEFLMDHCTIYGSIEGTAAVNFYNATNWLITNCIFEHFTNDYVITGSGGLVYNSDFYDYDQIGLAAPLGVLDTVNFNGDSCDIYGNIFLDPLFVDTISDFHLTWENFPTPDSTKSPCIDAGMLSSPYDPDGTISDMGRYFFDQRRPVLELSATLLDFDTVTVELSDDLPLSIKNTGDTNLILSNISNDLSVFSNNWNPTDTLIIPGDSLIITVSFTPDSEMVYTDTLRIESNASLDIVELLGEGVGVVTGIEEKIESFALYCPNLISAEEKIRFALPKFSAVNLLLFDVTGRLASVLVKGQLEAGMYEVKLNTYNLNAGLYFCCMTADDFSKTEKIVILK
ncbi:right-handed parallel beta-helix repeat-containing protein [candidate division WOR-3 bacterium]|nr:right-handed parallel beta-helix repeat-containing protein [candidate division WOR-3 bacterium]